MTGRASRRAWAAGAALVAAMLWAGLALAEEPPVITYKVVHSANAYPQGGVYPLALELTVAPGFHINSDKPDEPDLYPTSLILNGTAACALSPAVFPQGHAYKAPWLAKPVQVFDGKVLVRFDLTVDKKANAGEHLLSGRLNFQACDDSSCLMPENLEISMPLKVAPAGQTVEKLNPAIFKK